MGNIKVAVRIRPFSKRELAQGDTVIVQRENKSIVVTNPKVPERQDGDSRKKSRKFFVDFCYDSKEPGMCSQEMVYREIGLEVLDSMFEGYNACIFAYGHSASGKTYTMMGIKDDPGLTPRICQGLFDRVSQKPYNSRIQYEIFVSFLEIYNEKVRDLLADDEATATTTNFSLRVREHPKLGPYVQDLSQHLVNDKKKALELINIGNRRRITAATENNIYSSRSHTIFTILCKQTGHETVKVSKVHLVDLAGSERANAVQNKTRLKEGANINKSLVTLGNVISALAESYENFVPNKEYSNNFKASQPFVPYRDSVLTWLLKDTLGGNSNTIMIATVSPASSCLNETINTLRYARKTKSILNQPIINEDPKVRTIRELKEEIIRLKNTIKYFQLNDSGDYCQQDNLCRLFKKTKDQTKFHSDDETDQSSISKAFISNHSKELHGKVGRKSLFSHGVPEIPSVASAENDSCKINNEKESDVNEPVIDSLAAETQIFSDSLEDSSSLLSLKTKSQSDVENSEFEERYFVKNVEARKHNRNLSSILKIPKSQSKRESNLRSGRDFSSCENLPKMLHRSRPDLIKSIFIRSKEEFPLGSSQSCTDISNFSLSTSENSLNSSESTDMQSSENKIFRDSSQKESNFVKDKEKMRNGQTPKRGKKTNEPFQTTSKKKDKRSEIVEAVTTRLYVSKRKPKNRHNVTQAPEKEDCEDESELEELKLCKRARMKLFDLSRKLAMTKKVKKTVDNDTQTDFHVNTVRLKEKCIITDQSGVTKVEDSGTNTSSDENLKQKLEHHTVMNQVFIPRSSDFVVRCGKNVRVEVKREINKRDLGTQTKFDRKFYETGETFTFSSIPPNSEWFSDDSLDLEKETKFYNENVTEHDKTAEKKFLSQEGLNLNSHFQNFNPRTDEVAVNTEGNRWNSQQLFIPKPMQQLTCNKKNSDEHKDWKKKTFKENSKHKNSSVPLEEIYVIAEDHQLPEVYTNISKEETVNTVEFDASTSNITFPSTMAKENSSSENSISSFESNNLTSSGETSSEDFIFYERPKGKHLESPIRVVSDRELYTITENSEQSDFSDAFSPRQKQDFVKASQVSGCVSALSKIKTPINKGQQRWEEKRFDKFCSNEIKIPNPPEDHLEIARTMDKVNEEILLLENCQTAQACDVSHCSSMSKGNSFSLLKSCNGFSPDSIRFNLSENLQTNSSNYVVPNSDFTPVYATISKHPENRESNFKTKCKNLVKNDHKLCDSDTDHYVETEIKGETNRSKSKKVKWMNLKFDVLNLNKNSSFIIDTPQLSLKEPSKKDQSTETISASDDSITFVFMGPAKQKTSMLMEIVRRGLNKDNSLHENENNYRDSKSRGVQCESKLMRSVSVDTALFALSRIAKNQEPRMNIPRITSLSTLAGEEMQTVFSEGKFQVVRESSCQCDLDTELSKMDATNQSLESSKHYNGRTCVRNKSSEDEVKLKKSVSWLREPKCKDAEANTEKVLFQSNRFPSSRGMGELSTSHFNYDHCQLSEIETSGTNNVEDYPLFNRTPSNQSIELDLNSQTRRVRFSKPENIAEICRIMNHKTEAIHSSEDVSEFVKEMTQLLKHLKSLSISHDKSIEEVAKQPEDLTNLKDTGKYNELKTSLKKSCKSYEVETERDETPTAKSESQTVLKEKPVLDSCNLTWPRRRTTNKKPPMGNKLWPGPSKSSRLSMFSRCNDSNSNAFIDFTRYPSYSSTVESAISNLNTSFLSTVNNSYDRNGQSRLPSSRSIYTNGKRYPKDTSTSSSIYLPRTITPRAKLFIPNFDWILDLEMDLEESCRRLEIAARKDKIRQETLESKRTGFSYGNRVSEISSMMDTESKWERRRIKGIPKSSTKRQNGECFGFCKCRRTQMNNCRCFLSNSYSSTFELDSFGPGSKHCYQFCMFCQKKDLEMYYSVPNLNTECNFDRCRLNYYGYCPCSSIRIRDISPSPRAYKQNLLNLRRKIVNATKC